MKGGILALAGFLLGLLIVTLPQAESRLAAGAVPKDWPQQVSIGDISVYADRAVIAVPGLRYARVVSDSMAPVITSKSTVLERVPKSAGEIQQGDIISFYEPSNDGVVLHLVTEVIQKDGGTFYKTKGVANAEEDPWVVPFDNVKGVMVGVLR
ncbi:signal peptidase I [Candidatus Woesearchaeota archaeon]|nr:MAG: signal peptidase I [Candidatus Woesearchaeota archaeon]